MNQNPQASTPEFTHINIPGDMDNNVPLLPFPLFGLPATTDHNWQFRKMRPTCFATNKNAPGRPLDARTLEEAVERIENEKVGPTEVYEHVPEETLNGRD